MTDIASACVTDIVTVLAAERSVASRVIHWFNHVGKLLRAQSIFAAFQSQKWCCLGTQNKLSFSSDQDAEKRLCHFSHLKSQWLVAAMRWSRACIIGATLSAAIDYSRRQDLGWHVKGAAKLLAMQPALSDALPSTLPVPFAQAWAALLAFDWMDVACVRFVVRAS